MIQRFSNYATVAVLLLTVGCADEDVESPRAPSTEPKTVVVDVELGELFVRPSSISATEGDRLVLSVHNGGALQHDLKVVGTEQGTALLSPGASESFTIDHVTSSVRLRCTVPGHEAAGMVTNLDVAEALAPPQARTTPATRATGAARSGTAATIDPNATPPAAWQPRDARLAPAAAETVHRLTLEATETIIEIAPGITQELWTFNNLVPGPTLRGRVGDVFEVTLVNRGQLGHSIDFHASKVAWNDEMRTIQPGESLMYRFEAKHAGIFMYHCGTAPALHHIGNGMYGAIVIDPPGLPPVDHEFALVQGEYYLGPIGQPGDLTKMQSNTWDAVLFNGYFNQYLHAPIRIEPGQRVRAWVLDAGPSENSAFHIVGTIFDTMYKEGAYTLRPGDGRGGAQALDLQPSQRGFVEFTMDEAGLYPIVTHKFSNVGKGALGLFQAGAVDATGGGSH